MRLLGKIVIAVIEPHKRTVTTLAELISKMKVEEPPDLENLINKKEGNEGEARFMKKRIEDEMKTYGNNAEQWEREHEAFKRAIMNVCEKASIQMTLTGKAAYIERKKGRWDNSHRYT